MANTVTQQVTQTEPVTGSASKLITASKNVVTGRFDASPRFPATLPDLHEKKVFYRGKTVTSDRDSDTPRKFDAAFFVRALKEQRNIAEYVDEVTGLKVREESGLTISYTCGNIHLEKEAPKYVPCGTLTLDDNATNYVECDSTGTVQYNTSGFSDYTIAMAIVTTSSGSITDITDRRSAYFITDATLNELSDLSDVSSSAPLQDNIIAYDQSATQWQAKAGGDAGLLEQDGSETLVSNWDVGDGNYVYMDKVRARDADGLSLYDDGNQTGFDIKDAGDIDVYTPSNQTMELQTPVWKDLGVAALRFTTPSSNAPTLTQVTNNGSGSNGVYAYAFVSGSLNEAYGEVPFPHAYVEGTDYKIYVNWAPEDANTGDIIWGAELVNTEVGSAIGNSTKYTVTASAPGTSLQHENTQITTVTGTGLDIGADTLVRLFRDGGNASDTYGSDVFLLGMTFLFKVDTLGSRQEFTK